MWAVFVKDETDSWKFVNFQEHEELVDEQREKVESLGFEFKAFDLGD